MDDVWELPLERLDRVEQERDELLDENRELRERAVVDAQIIDHLWGRVRYYRGQLYAAEETS